MLQYPINVYPDETAFDSTDSNYYRGIKLTFKGDILSALYWRVYDYHTGNIVIENKIYREQMRPLCYNNEEIEIPNIFQSLTVGRYVLQVMMTQTRVNRNGQNPTRVNIHDRFVSRGKTRELYQTSSTNIILEDNINVIYEWNKNGTVYSPSVIEETVDTPPFTFRAAEMVIKIGQDVMPILSYDASTGIVTLPNSLSQDYPAGTTYQIYANYLISNLYYFEVAKQTQFQYQSIDWNVYGGTFDGFAWQGNTSYETQGGTMIKYYTYEIIKIDEYDDEWEVYKSDRIYSQNVHFDFVDDYDDVGLSGYRYKGEVNDFTELPVDAEINDVYLNLFNEIYYARKAAGWEELTDCGGNYATRRYKVNVHCALQNGMELDTSQDAEAPERTDMPQLSYRTFTDEDNNWTEVNVVGSIANDTRFRIYRVNESANLYGIAPYKTLISDIKTPMFADYITGTHEKYRYMIVPYRPLANIIYNPIVTDTIENDFYGYTLTALHDTGKTIYNKSLYTVGENWKIMAAIEDTDNVQNLNRTVHIGNGKYAAVTGTENNYVSGSLTAELGRMVCGRKQTFKNDAAVMAEWRKFIAQDCPFILRNQKGDVWLVRISDGGSIKYGEEGRQISSAVTFSWVECGSIYDYLIQNEDIDRG